MTAISCVFGCASAQAELVIPPRTCHKKPLHCDMTKYRLRNKYAINKSGTHLLLNEGFLPYREALRQVGENLHGVAPHLVAQ